jgi:hypothetical protein
MLKKIIDIQRFTIESFSELYVKSKVMIGKLDKSPQLDMFRVPLKHLIREDHDLIRLAGKIKWDRISQGLKVNYSPDKGRRAIPVRKMAGLLILKFINGCSDNEILRLWTQDPCYQYFCGEVWFSEKAVLNRFDLVSFRKRIGKKGMEIIFYPELLRALKRLKHSQESRINDAHPHRNFMDFFKEIFITKLKVTH